MTTNLIKKVSPPQKKTTTQKLPLIEPENKKKNKKLNTKVNNERTESTFKLASAKLDRDPSTSRKKKKN